MVKAWYTGRLTAVAAALSLGLPIAAAAAAQEAAQTKPASQPVPSSASPPASTRPAASTTLVPSDFGAPPSRYVGPGNVTVRSVPPEDVADQATCVIQIESDGPAGVGAAPLDARTAASILRSTPVLEAAAEKALGGLRHGRLNDAVVVNVIPTGPTFLEVEVILLKGEAVNGLDEGRAAGLLSALCETLEAALRESTEGQRKAAEKRRVRAEQEVAAAKQRLADLRAKLRQYRAATAGVSPFGDPRHALQNMRNQRDQYEQQLASHRTRLRMIEPTAAPLLAEWAGVAELRQKQLDEVKAQAAAGKATAEQVAAHERRLNEARAQLDVHRRTAAGESDRGGEMASLRSTIALTEGQLKAVSDQLAKLEDEKTLKMLEELPDLQHEENRASSDVATAVSRAEQLRRTPDAIHEVTLRVLDGKADE